MDLLCQAASVSRGISQALGVETSLQTVYDDLPGAALKIEPTPLAIDKNWLLTHCWGLVELWESDSKIHLVHYTVREYLVNTAVVETSWKRNMIRHPFRSADIDLAEICVLYLSIDAFVSRIDRKPIEKEPNGFLDYAIEYWHVHASLADDLDSSPTVLLKLLDWPSTKVLGHWAHLHQSKIGHGTLSDYWGWTALHASAAFGLHNLAIAIRDVERSDLTRWDIGDAIGRTPLSLASWKGNQSLVKLLLEERANTATKDMLYNFSPLQWAASQGHHEVVELLLEKGAGVQDSVDGRDPLLFAAARDHDAVLKVLLERGADPNSADKHYGWTPLHLSAGYGNKAVVLLLLMHGADPNILNPFTQRTPLYYAIAGGHQEVVKLLLDHGGGMQLQNLGLVSNLSISWVERVAFSFLRQHANDSSCQPSWCTSSKTNITCTPAGGDTTGQKGDDSKKGSKKRLREDSESGSGDGLGGSGNDPNKSPTLNLIPLSPSTGISLKLACPYYKYNPGRYSSQKLCRGPVGWPSINRVKEHLYKHHFVQICRRCYLIFEDLQGLETHYKAPTSCSAKLERDYGDGFDDNQLKLLKARTQKREFKGNELEYWKGVYRILFPEVEMSSIPSPCYEEENVTKKAYDDSCARARIQDPLLRSQIFQLMHDPMEVDVVGSLLDLINRHQAVSISPNATEHDGASLRTSGTPQLTNDAGLPLYQPSPGVPNFDCDWSSFPQMSAPWLLQQPNSQEDSGFYSVPSAKTEGGGMSLPHQPAELNYPPVNVLNVQNPVEGENIPISTPVLTTAEAGLQDQIDLDKFLPSWDSNNDLVSGVSQERDSTTETTGEEQ